QMSAVHAIESAFGATVGGELRALRRLIYCGEWIASHALHVAMLHAPDFLGFPDAIRMARDHGEIVRNGLALKKAGNDLMRVLGGREIHPVSVKAGGFHRVPTRSELAPMAETLKRARDIAVDLVRWAAGLPFPEFEERQVAHSTALHSVVKRRGAYHVGPLARYALNFDLLPGHVQALAREA